MSGTEQDLNKHMLFLLLQHVVVQSFILLNIYFVIPYCMLRIAFPRYLIITQR